VKIISRNGKSFLRISKNEWTKIGADFGVQDIFDWMDEPGEAQKKTIKAPPPPADGSYTTKNPLKSMPEEKGDYTYKETTEPQTQRSIKVEEDKAYEIIPKKDGTMVKRPINLVGVTSPEDFQKIQSAPKGYEENVRKEIIRGKVRSIVNAFHKKQFLFVGFWEKTKTSTWRHMFGQIISRIPEGENWGRLKIMDRAIKEVREAYVDNIDYIRGSGVSYVVDRVAESAHISKEYPEGKANFVGSALAAARQAFEQSKNVSGGKI